MKLIDNIKRTTFVVCINQELDNREFLELGKHYKKYLFPESKSFRSNIFNDVIIHFNESNHVLNDTFLLNNDQKFLFLTGDFFHELDKEKIKNISNENEFSQFVLKVNGSFNAIFFDKSIRKITLYNDIIGLKKFFYSFKNNLLLISSLLAVFYDENTQYNPDYINDFIFARIALSYETQFKNVYTVGPDFFVSIDLKNKKSTEHLHIRDHQLMTLNSDKEVLEKYFTIFQNFNNYIIKKSSNKDFYFTLTSGADTRIVLNMLLQSGREIKAAITNSAYSKEDARISKQICTDYKLGLIDSNEFPGLNEDTYNKIFYLTNGQIDIVTFINNYIEDSVIYYGSFGNFLSRRQYGNHRYMMNSQSKEQFIDRFFPFIFTGYEYSLLKKLLPASDINNIKSRFSKVFDQYFKNLDIKDSYYYFYKNLRNFYNDCRFVTGTYTGSSGILPFNNLELINLYNEFGFKETFSHRYHFMASYYRNPKLGTYKMGQFPLSVKYKPFFIYYLSEPITVIYDAIKKKNYRSRGKEELKTYFKTGYDYSKYIHIYDINSIIDALSGIKSPASLLNIIKWVNHMLFNFDELCKSKFNAVKKNINL